MSCSRVVVVGAGVVGAALAHRLAERGVDATVVDAARPGGGTSGSSFAWLNSNAKQPRAYHELNVAGMRAHRVLAAELAGGSVRDAPWYHPCGTLEWVDPASDQAELRSRVDRLRGWGYPARFVPAATAREWQPGLRFPDAVAELAVFGDEGYVDTALLVEALLARAGVLGVRVRADDAVVAVDVTGDRVRGVRLSSGERIAADAVACCAGWRTPQLAARVGVEVPLVRPGEPGSPAATLIARVPLAGAAGLRHVLRTPLVDVRPVDGGGVDGGGLVLEHADINATASLDMSPGLVRAGAVELLERARRVLGGLDDAGEPTGQVCVRPLPVDGHSIVGPVPSVAGCYLIVTHSGVTLAPHLARLAAAELMDGVADAELAPFRLTRFARSTR